MYVSALKDLEKRMSYVPFDLMTELRTLFAELGDEAAEIDSEANKQLC